MARVEALEPVDQTEAVAEQTQPVEATEPVVIAVEPTAVTPATADEHALVEHAVAPADADEVMISDAEVVIIKVETMLPMAGDEGEAAVAPTGEDDAPRAVVEPGSAPAQDPQSNGAMATAAVEAAPQVQAEAEGQAEAEVQTEVKAPVEAEAQAEARAQVEAEVQAETEVAPEVRPQGDTVANQVDQDLDAVGTIFTPPAGAAPAPHHAPVPSMWDASIRPRAQPGDDPADFLLEPLSAATARAEADLGNAALVAIERALFDGPDARAAVTAPQPAVAPAVPQPHAIAVPTPRHGAGDPLAALTAMSDEERIALFT